MWTAGAPDGTQLAARAASPGAEYWCPACGGGLVLRCGRRLAPHFAHRPRQACPRKPAQLRLFELPAPPVPPRGGHGPERPLRWHQVELPFEPRPARKRRTVRIHRRPLPVTPVREPWWRRLVARARPA